MQWSELCEKAKEMGFSISYYLDDDDVEIGYIYCNDYIYLEEDGKITTNTEAIVADNRTYEQMLMVMEALK